MASRIRVIERVEPVSFGEQLEDRARQIVRARAGPGSVSDSTITIGVRREIALTLDHLQRLRGLNHSLSRNLTTHECYLLTEILQREPRGHAVYNDIRLPERDRLRDRLRELERERRHLAMVNEDQTRSLRDRLLVLLNRHAHLQP